MRPSRWEARHVPELDLYRSVCEGEGARVQPPGLMTTCLMHHEHLLHLGQCPNGV